MGMASCILFPIGMYQLFTVSSLSKYSVLIFAQEPVEIDSTVLLSLLSVILFIVVADYYVESISAHQLVDLI